jgi:hypothetical protein
MSYPLRSSNLNTDVKTKVEGWSWRSDKGFGDGRVGSKKAVSTVSNRGLTGTVTPPLRNTEAWKAVGTQTPSIWLMRVDQPEGSLGEERAGRSEATNGRCVVSYGIGQPTVQPSVLRSSPPLTCQFQTLSFQSVWFSGP